MSNEKRSVLVAQFRHQLFSPTQAQTGNSDVAHSRLAIERVELSGKPMKASFSSFFASPFRNQTLMQVHNG
jgi:hypothetical protein